MSYAIQTPIEAWHAKPPQFTTELTVGSLGLLLGALVALALMLCFVSFDVKLWRRSDQTKQPNLSLATNHRP
jgi:hypothetical protein